MRCNLRAGSPYSGSSSARMREWSRTSPLLAWELQRLHGKSPQWRMTRRSIGTWSSCASSCAINGMLRGKPRERWEVDRAAPRARERMPASERERGGTPLSGRRGSGGALRFPVAGTMRSTMPAAELDSTSLCTVGMMSRPVPEPSAPRNVYLATCATKKHRA